MSSAYHAHIKISKKKSNANEVPFREKFILNPFQDDIF
jgi:hypothetical protein